MNLIGMALATRYGNVIMVHQNINMIKKKNKKISGLSLLEALISTAIVGIGFVAILQMTNYSIQSIFVSGERTKANYLTNVIAVSYTHLTLPTR